MYAVYQSMEKPAYVFDSRGLYDKKQLEDIGFVTYRIGKPKTIW